MQAESAKEAVEKFYRDWHGADIGSESFEGKALWIDPEGEILEFPDCERLHENKNGEHICGELQEDGSGEDGMCCVDGYDGLGESCPIEIFLCGYREKGVRETVETRSGSITVIRPWVKEAALAVKT